MIPCSFGWFWSGPLQDSSWACIRGDHWLQTASSNTSPSNMHSSETPWDLALSQSPSTPFHTIPSAMEHTFSISSQTNTTLVGCNTSILLPTLPKYPKAQNNSYIFTAPQRTKRWPKTICCRGLVLSYVAAARLWQLAPEPVIAAISAAL